MNIFNEIVELPDGRIIDDYLQVVMAEHAVIVAKNAEQRWLVQRQYKHGPRSICLTFPAGHLNPDEQPLEAAKRELLEETGYVCSIWHSVGSFILNGNQGAGRAHIFIAESMRHETTNLVHDASDLEEQEMIWLDEAELTESLKEGRFNIVSHALGCAYALNPALWP